MAAAAVAAGARLRHLPTCVHVCAALVPVLMQLVKCKISDDDESVGGERTANPLGGAQLGDGRPRVLNQGMSFQHHNWRRQRCDQGINL